MHRFMRLAPCRPEKREILGKVIGLSASFEESPF